MKIAALTEAARKAAAEQEQDALDRAGADGARHLDAAMDATEDAVREN